MKPWSREWFDDCWQWRGKILEGRYSHWCIDWDGLPVDETTPEFDCCNCFKCKCGLRMKQIRYEGILHFHDDRYKCPRFRLWNFWKHDWVDLGFDERAGRKK